MNHLNYDDYRWLISPAAAEILQILADDDREITQQAKFLRSRFSHERTHLLLEQVALRRRATSKFPQAKFLYFTRKGLEQSTDWFIARHKAERFPQGQLIADLCCGLGGDLMALSEVGQSLAIDHSQVACIFARANVRSSMSEHEHGFHHAVVNGDVASVRLNGAAAWHIDPGRRKGKSRTTRIERFEPNLSVIERLIQTNPHAAIKLAPATKVPRHWREVAELEWISRDRECKQLVAWFGGLARTPGASRVTVLGDDHRESESFVRHVAAQPPEFGSNGRYLYVPNPAVIAAGLVPSLAAELGLTALAPRAAYLFGDTLVCNPLLTCFEVVEHMPFDVRRLKSLLANRQIGRLEIKKCGVDIEPETLRKRLRTRGNESATLLLARKGGRVAAWLTRRIEK